MPTDPLLPEGRNFPRAQSPDGTISNERKRRRKVLSCYDCRRRKLQCDRVMPACGRCSKAGQAAGCLYLDDSTDVPIRDGETEDGPSSSRAAPSYGHTNRAIAATTASQGDPLSRLEFQENRIKQLEAALAQAGAGNAVQRPRGTKVPPTPDSMNGVIDPHIASQDHETILFRGKSFKTQFHGNTHPGALIAHIPELHGFTKDTLEQYPALQRIREDMRNLECRTSYAGDHHHLATDVELRALLPSKMEADQLIQLYLDNFGGLYHIIHMPTFHRDYSAIFDDVDKADVNNVAIVLLMMAAAQCLTTAQPWLYYANSSAAREKAVAAIQMVDDWLVSQSQKHVIAADFQIRILSSLAKLVAARKYKRAWTDLGSTLRFCMAAGLHRSPDLLRKPTSLLDKELRKRVWAAIAELELQAAFDRGLMSASWTLQSDCPPPSRIDDNDIDQSTEQLPRARRANEYTNVSYLAASSETLMLRTSLNTYLNNIRQTVNFDDAKRFTDEIQAHLSEVPNWIGASAEVPQALLSLNLRQYLLVLHDRQYRVAMTKSERDFSKLVLVETATKVLATHRSLTSKGIFALELLCCDQLRAALSICHVTSSLDPQADDALSTSIRQTAHRLVPEAIEMLTDKIIRFGREQRQLWILLATNGFMKTKENPEKRLLYMQEAVDKIVRPYYKIMACQEETPAQITPGTLPLKDTPKGILEYHPSNPQTLGGTSTSPETGEIGVNGVTDPNMLDLDYIAAWTFDDWSYNPLPMDFNQTFSGDVVDVSVDQPT